jgi:hypothetical protein
MFDPITEESEADMAKETVVRLIDDIDGSPATTTVRFGWAGSDYQIDLSSKNARALETAMAPYVKAATRVTGARRGPSRRSAAGSRLDLSAVREWAVANGHNVSTRGRIPGIVLDAYHAAQHAVSGSPAAEAQQSTARKAPAKKAAPRKRPAKKAAPRKATGRRAPR